MKELMSKPHLKPTQPSFYCALAFPPLHWGGNQGTERWGNLPMRTAGKWQSWDLNPGLPGIRGGTILHGTAPWRMKNDGQQSHSWFFNKGPKTHKRINRGDLGHRFSAKSRAGIHGWGCQGLWALCVVMSLSERSQLWLRFNQSISSLSCHLINVSPARELLMTGEHVQWNCQWAGGWRTHSSYTRFPSFLPSFLSSFLPPSLSFSPSLSWLLEWSW